MKKLKLFATLLAFVLLLSALTFSVSAASATVALSGGTSVTVGQQVKVTVTITGSETIGSWLFSLNYDPAFLDYVSGADSGGGGALRFSDSVDSGVRSITKTVTFKTKKIGATTVSVNSPQIVGFDSLSNMSAGSASRKITINAAPTLSGDNNLASLYVGEAAITPEFNANTTAYTATVPFEVAGLSVSGTPAHNGARVSISPTQLQVGENQINITVTAQNGRTKTYTLTVTRQESELAGVTANVGGTDYAVAFDPSTLTVPEGYTATTSNFADRKILSFASPQDSIRVVYLTREETGAWFVYDEATSTFSPMVTLPGIGANFVILTPPAGTLVPQGFIPKDLTVGEMTLGAYQSEDSLVKNVYLVYAMAQNGTCGFYYYDATLSSFTSFFETSAPVVESGDGVKEMASRAQDAEKRAARMEILALALSLVSVLLLIGMILALALKGKKKSKAPTDSPRVNAENSALLMNDSVPVTQIPESEETEEEEMTGESESEKEENE